VIVPMKKVQIAVLKEDYEKVIKSLQKEEVIMVVNKVGGDVSFDLTLNEALEQRVNRSITTLKRYEEKKPLFNYVEEDYEKFKEVDKSSLELLKNVEDLTLEKEGLLEKIKELSSKISSLILFEDFEDLPNEIHNTIYTRMHLGVVPTRNVSKITKELEDEEFIFKFYGTNPSVTALFAPCYFLDEEKLLQILKKYEFSEFKLPSIDCLVKDYLNGLMDEKKSFEQRLDEIEKEIITLSSRCDELRFLNDQILTAEELNHLSFEATLETKIIEGFVRNDKLKELKKAVSSATSIYELEITDPTKDDKVPTYTLNNKFVSQFETVTDMFSKPSIDDVDPNPVMSVWYWFLFGMMMGDAGYGVLMILGAFIFKKIARPKGGTLKLVNIIMYSGVPTIFWGIIFGSYFGFNPNTDFGWKFVWYWFNPMNDPIKMLLVSCSIGALHLITGLVIKSIICIKEKNYIELLSKNISWILILCGIGLFFIQKTVGIVSLALGVGLIVTLSGIKKKSIFGKAAFGILGLYDVTSYLGDVLSYSRIMALAMSSAAIAMVMNTLAQMVGGSLIGAVFAGLIFIIGHIFNVVLGLLSAYVHDARLQYIEFFGKFYNGGGIDFKPLSIKTKYINEIKNLK